MPFIVLVRRKKKILKMNGWIHKTSGAFLFYAIAQRRERSLTIEENWV